MLSYVTLVTNECLALACPEQLEAALWGVLRLAHAAKHRTRTIFKLLKASALVRPVYPQTIPLERIERALCKHYDLHVQNERSRAADHYYSSAVWRFEADDHGWYVKIFTHRKDQRERLQDEINLYRYLNGHGIRAPAVVPTVLGRDFAELEFHRRSYCLMVMRSERLREISPATVTYQELKAIATTIALMHRLLKSYVYPYTPPRGALINIPSDGVSPLLLSSPNRHGFTQDEIHRLKWLETRQLSYLRSNLSTSGLSNTLLHGDLILANLRLFGSHEAYLFDFTDRFRGPMVRDLAVLIQDLYASAAISFQRFEQLKSALLEQYLSVNPLTEQDREALIAYVVWYTLARARHNCLTAKRRGFPVRVSKIKRQIELAEYLLEDY